MRFVSLLILSFLTIFLYSSTTFAAEGGSAGEARNFGTVACQPKFQCSDVSSDQIAEMANDCSVHGFGISTAQSGIFDNSTLDSGSCMDGTLPSLDKNSGGTGRAMTPRCCITADGDTCSMSCQLLMY